MTAFLTGLLSSIIRPIIQAEIAELKQHIVDQVGRKDIYDKHDKKKLELAEEMAQADTKEERYAILQKMYDYQPSLD
jgi:hypothetical protein